MKAKTLSIIKHGALILVSAIIIFIVFIFSMVFQVFDSSVNHVLGNAFWFLIFFVLPVISFILPIILTAVLKLNFKKSVLISVILILICSSVLLGSIFAVHSYLRDFTPEKWQKYKWERHYMLEDMTQDINFIGMQKENVFDMLGDPSSPYADTGDADLIEYLVGSNVIDPIMVTFVFEDNKVVEVYKYTEFRTSKKLLY